jgi:5-methylcytosine-specific restriction endonuclease McrA
MRLPRNKRDQIHLAWNFECAYCGEPLGRSGTLDHVIPKALGGSADLHNVISCCLACNSSKGHRDWITWFRTQPFWTDTREWAIVQWLGQNQPRHPEQS